MTRKEKAIMYFKDMRKKFCEDYLLGIPKDSVAYKATMAEKEFYDTAIEVLEQEPYGDCISRQAVLDAIDAAAWAFCDYLIRNGRNDVQKPVSLFADKLREYVREELPPINPISNVSIQITEREKYGRFN